MGTTVVAVRFGSQESCEGVTYAQAMEAFERFHVQLEATPTVADRMGIPYRLMVRILDGEVWPAAREYWLNQVFRGL